MTVEVAVRMLAGVMVLASLAMAHWVSPYWLLLTAFVGLNLLQSALTNRCPAVSVFRWMGLRAASACASK